MKNFVQLEVSRFDGKYFVNYMGIHEDTSDFEEGFAYGGEFADTPNDFWALVGKIVKENPSRYFVIYNDRHGFITKNIFRRLERIVNLHNHQLNKSGGNLE